MSAEADSEKTPPRKYNEAKLAGLYEEYYDRIARYAHIHIGHRAEAEDIAGEVFLKALESLGSYQERGIPMQAWLFRIAHNMVVDHLRKREKRRTVSIDTLQIESGKDPATIAEKNLELERVSKAMEQITAAQRNVVGLRFFGGLTSKEVGQVLNKSDGAVREMQRAAIETLRRLLITE
ncbi:MAG: sigma-70 family RNA polymerase sigma factor [Dehalococcoidales bacterium]|jgi:RNA polymerase sigma-70 factor (ECF subfamily)